LVGGDFNVCIGYKRLKILPEVMLHVELIWIYNARWFRGFKLIGGKCVGCIPEHALSTCLT